MLIPAAGEETDRRIRIVEAPGYGIVGKSVTIAHGGRGSRRRARLPAGRRDRLTIRRDGEPPRVESVPVGRRARHRRADHPRRPDRGGADRRPAARRGLRRSTTAPWWQINGVRDRLRVLLVSGEPHAGERTWRRLLKADPAVDLVHFTILRPPEKDDLTPLNELALIAFPVRELFQVKIGEFDLIILDRFQNRGILPPPYLRNIADYVRGGGALLLSVGPEFSRPGQPGAEPAGRRAAGAAGLGRGGGGGRVPPAGHRRSAPAIRSPPGWPGWPAPGAGEPALGPAGTAASSRASRTARR